MRGRYVATAIAMSICASACQAQRDRQIVELGGEAMGSTWSVQLVDRANTLTRDDIRDIDADAREVLHRIDTLMSTWDADSELSRFNQAQSVARVPVAPETFDVFRHAVTFARETDGAFDVTVGALVEAWGFGAAAGAPGPPPDPGQLARLREAAGAGKLRLDPGGRWVQKLHPALRCDFSGLAPGHAADRIADLIERRGVGDFLVDVGGEMVGRGRNTAGDPWQVAVERPEGAAGAAQPPLLDRVIPLTDAAMATSGDYRNYREIDGVRVAHILDPRTGRPIGHRLASATVVADRAVRADALATALMVLGPDDGMALAERLDVAALLLVRLEDGTFEQRRSPRLNVMLGGR